MSFYIISNIIFIKKKDHYLYFVTFSQNNLAVKPTTGNIDDTSNQNSTVQNVCNLPFRNIEVHTFFTDRNEVVERAIHDCTETLIQQNNEELVGSWLLTEYVMSI